MRYWKYVRRVPLALATVALWYWHGLRGYAQGHRGANLVEYVTARMWPFVQRHLPHVTETQWRWAVHTRQRSDDNPPGPP